MNRERKPDSGKEENKLKTALIIKDPLRGVTYYGGDQSWFEKNTRFYGGCGVVALANALRILLFQGDKKGEFSNNKEGRNKAASGEALWKLSEDLKPLSKKDITREEYTRIMNDMYSSMHVFELPLINYLYNRSERKSRLFKYLIPSFGMSQGTLIRGMLKYSKKNGLLLMSHVYESTYSGYDEGLAFIKKGLREAGYVIILTSFNKHSLKVYSKVNDPESSYNSSMKSHFATITDILYNDKGAPLLRLSSWGREARVSYGELYASWQKRRAYTSSLFYFTKTESRAVYGAAIRKSIFPAFISLRKTLFKS
ncbi:MAG: hypothetical protein K5931_02080 [Lachnospiraceae bacterium]|nr:hypothetical protein [Lachnospiraceae bacterium]